MPKGIPNVIEKPRLSERGRRLRNEDILRPLDQIRTIPGGNGISTTGAWAYYLRPDGATITDALVLYPNGGIPDMDDQRLRARYGENAELYRERQRRRGLEFIGPTLTDVGIRRLLEVLESNREDEDLFLQEEIADAKEMIKNSDLPDVRNQAKRRVRQLTRRLETIRQGFDPDELSAELKEIARAQQLAQVPPAILRVMRSMIGEVNERMLEHFRNNRTLEGAPAGMSHGSGESGGEFEGKDHLEL